MKNSLRKNTAWMFVGQVAQLSIRMACFVIVARFLGVEQYGMFVGVTALVAIFSPFSGLGSENILVKHITRDKSLFGQYWGNGLFLIFIISVVLLGFTTVAAHAVFPETTPMLLVFFVAISDLFFVKILGLVGFAFGGVQQLDKTAWFNVLLNVSRLVAALVLISLPNDPSVITWGFLYLASGASVAVVGVLVVNRTLGSPKPVISRIHSELLQGFYFSAGLSAQNLYNNIDKTLLVRLSSLEATGIYSAAYRIIDAAFIPLGALLASTYPKFFQHGSKGLEGSLNFAKRLLPFTAVYGLTAAVGLFLLAPLVPFLLGAEYRFAVETIRWLAPIPFLRAVHYFLADALTGSGFQGLRSFVQIGVALFNIVINFWLIPIYSWKGAAWASLASDSLLMVGLLGCLAILQIKGIHGKSHPLCS